MCPYLEFFWSVFSPNAKNLDKTNSEYGDFSRSDSLEHFYKALRLRYYFVVKNVPW